MGRKRDKLCWRINRRKLFRSSASSRTCRNHNNNNNKGSSESSIVVLNANANANANANDEEEVNSSSKYSANGGLEFMMSRKDIAAITIQACIRGHLARQTVRALKSLIKLQALVRGVIVRRQARIALCCMHALARLQVTIRARQLIETHP